MFLFLGRLIVVIIALSLISSAGRFLQRMWANLIGSVPTGPRKAAVPGGGTTVLQQDPVCGTYVSIDSSLKKIVDGKVLHFCSDNCRDLYKG
jgi:YHS domain-containing protein